MKKKWYLKFALFVSLTMFYTAGIFAQSPNGNAQLFNLVGAKRFGDKSLSIAAVQQQPIEINFALVSPERREIQISDLDGNVYSVERRESEGFIRQNADTFTWNGKIYNDDGFAGDVILTVHKGAMCGLIYTPTGVYNITPQANGAHVLVKIDQGVFPDEHPKSYFDWLRENSAANPIFSSQNLFERPSTINSPSSPSADDGSQIDVMIVYTSAVRMNLGSVANADAFAAQAVATTNMAYANSGIIPRLRLVRSEEINYAEQGTLSAALSWVRSDATVAADRNTYKADAVGLIVQGPVSDGCGLAYLMGNGNNNSAFQSNAFEAVLKSCAVDNLSYPHELGHNQGANHNPADAGTLPAQAVFTYAFGHCVSGGANPFRTVMSYQGTECGSFTTRYPYFSNPNVNYMGQPTGTADRNNALTLNNTALTVSQFRTNMPTAASISITGRVITLQNLGLTNALVTLTDRAGNSRTVFTGRMGSFRFDAVTAGETYILSVQSKRYAYAPQIVTATEDLTDTVFSPQLR